MHQRPSIIKTHKVTVELFPFLSVLACTIGSLILLIVLISSQAFSDEKTVTIIPRSEEESIIAKEPFYVELKADGLVIHPSRQYVSIENAFAFNSPFMKLLRQVEAQKEKQYLIIAVRPSSYDIFDQVRNQVEQRGIDIGYEPIDEEWKLDIKK